MNNDVIIINLDAPSPTSVYDAVWTMAKLFSESCQIIESRNQANYFLGVFVFNDEKTIIDAMVLKL